MHSRKTCLSHHLALPDVAPTGGLTYSDTRRLQLQVITDF